MRKSNMIVLLLVPYPFVINMITLPSGISGSPKNPIKRVNLLACKDRKALFVSRAQRRKH